MNWRAIIALSACADSLACPRVRVGGEGGAGLAVHGTGPRGPLPYAFGSGPTSTAALGLAGVATRRGK